MDWKTGSYLAYLAISAGLTVWVARTLSRDGTVFLLAVLPGGEELARSVNRLLVVGFYLVNSGFVALALRTDAQVTDLTGTIEELSRKLGLVLLLVGLLHLLNVLFLSHLRRQRLDADRLAAPLPGPAYPPAPPPATRR